METTLIISQHTYIGESTGDCIIDGEYIITSNNLWKLYSVVPQGKPLIVSIRAIKANKEMYGECCYVNLSRTSTGYIQIDVYSNWHRRKDYIEFDGKSITRVNTIYMKNGDDEEYVKKFLGEYNKGIVRLLCSTYNDEQLCEFIRKMSLDLDAESDVKIR